MTSLGRELGPLATFQNEIDWERSDEPIRSTRHLGGSQGIEVQAPYLGRTSSSSSSSNTMWLPPQGVFPHNGLQFIFCRTPKKFFVLIPHWKSSWKILTCQHLADTLGTFSSSCWWEAFCLQISIISQSSPSPFFFFWSLSPCNKWCLKPRRNSFLLTDHL